MLQAMHDRSAGIITWVIILLLIMGFVLWQIGDYLGIGDPASVIEVNDDKITENDWREFYNRAVSSIGKRPEGEEDKKLRDLIKQQLIMSSSEYQYARDIGYYVSDQYLDAYIQSIPQFRDKGQFNPEYLSRFLRQSGYSYKMFKQKLARDLYREQFKNGISRSEFVTEKELDYILKSEYRLADVEYVQIAAKAFRPEVKYNDFTLKEFYQKNLATYAVPEKLKLSYVQIKFSDIEKEINLQEADLKKYYEENKASYRTAPLRKASHLLLKLAKDAKKEELDKVMKKAATLHAKLKDKGDFTALVKLHSDDKFSPGGDLGVIDPVANPKLYKAVEKLKKGDISEPVRSDSGVHILKVTLAKAGTIKTYEQVQAEIKKTLRNKMAQKEFVTRSERLNDLAIENADSLDSAAETLGLKIQTSDWIYRDGTKNKDIGAYKKIRDTAFVNPDVFADGDPGTSVNSYLIELDRGKPTAFSIVIRLNSYKAKSTKPFDEVKDAVKENYIVTEITKKTQKKAQELLAELKTGKAIKTLASANRLKVVQVKKMNRGMTKHPAELVKAAFKLGVPQKDKLLAETLQLPNGDAILLKVNESSDGLKKSVNDRLKVIYKQVHERQFAQNLLISVGEFIKSNSVVTTNDKIIYKDNEN